MLRIAYYEQNKYHTEILCVFLNYFGSNITVYNNKDMSDWIKYYKSIFNFEHKNHLLLINEIDKYDKIIIGSSSDTGELLVKDIYEKNKSKFIFVCHLKKDLDTIYNNLIVLTPINKTNKNNYILPIFSAKQNILIKKETIIGIIGRFKYKNRDDNQIIQLIKTNLNKNFKIHIYSRHIDYITNSIKELEINYPNKIKLFYGLKTIDLINHFDQLKFLWILTSNESFYYKDRLCGMIPLSFNFNVPSIIPKELNQIYKIKNCVEYKNDIGIDQIINYPNYEELVNNLIIEKKEIIKNNNIVISMILNN